MIASRPCLFILKETVPQCSLYRRLGGPQHRWILKLACVAEIVETRNFEFPCQNVFKPGSSVSVVTRLWVAWLCLIHGKARECKSAMAWSCTPTSRSFAEYRLVKHTCDFTCSLITACDSSEPLAAVLSSNPKGVVLPDMRRRNNTVNIATGDGLCGLVVGVLGYRSGGPGSILGTTRKKSSESGTGSTQPREYN
jgi:hypothetical protein